MFVTRPVELFGVWAVRAGVEGAVELAGDL
jgi:hypothetical protein